MSGEPPEHNRDQQTSSASNSFRRYVPIAPTDHHQRVDPQLVFIPIAVSSLGGPQVTSMEQSKAGASGGAQSNNKRQRGGPTGKNVVVLKSCDVIVRDDGTVSMPNTIELAQLKKEENGQFKTDVQISSRMTDEDIKRIIVEKFPFLECQRFYCAAAVDNRTRLDFHGKPRIWDGDFIKKTIKGNSVLYIFAEENPTVAGQSSEHFPEQIDGTDNQSQMTVSSQSVIPSVSHKSCSNAGPLQGSMRKGAATATATLVHDVTASSLPTETRTARDTTPVSSAHHPQNPKWSGEGPTLKCTYEQTNKRFDQQLSKKTRTTTSVLKHKNNLKSPATRKNPYARPPPSASISKKDNSIHQIKRQLPILSDYTTLFPKNNISTTTDQKSLGQPSCLNADATTSLLSVQMNNLGITNAPPLQPQASHSEKVTELQRVDDGENSHGDSHDRPAPTSPQSNFLFGSIDRPKQTTDVSRKGTEEIVYTNLTDLTDKQLEPGHVGASASNHEVLDPMGTTPSSISDLESDPSILSWITSYLGDTTIGEPNIDVFDHFSESTDIDDFQLENGGSRGDGRVLQTTPSCDEDNQRPATHPITVPPPCHPSAPPLNMQLNFVEEHQPQGNNTVQMPAVSKILQGTAPDEYGTNSDPSYTGIGSGYDSTSSGLGNSLDPTETTETTDGDTVLNPSEDRSAMDQLIPPADIQRKVSMFPREVDLSGGYFCSFEFIPELLPGVDSGHAAVGNLGTIDLKKQCKHLVGYDIPPSDEPGVQPVTIWSKSGELLGNTELNYRKKPEPEFRESLERVAKEVNRDPSKMGPVLSRLADCCGGHGITRSGETQNYGRFGSTETVQVLLTLLYKAAECGAQLFIELMLNSSAGRVIFHEYKDSVPLPEVIARNHGHENTALYLEEINARFSKDPTPEDRKRVLDWPGFLAAINSPQDESSDASEDESPQPDVRNDSDSSYLGDVESLSCDSAEPSSDSEGDLSEMFSKVSVKEDEIQREGNMAEKEEREFVYQPLNDLSWTVLDEKVNVSIKKRTQGLSLGCSKDVAQTAVKKVQVQDNRTPFDSDDEMHGTDANRDERGQENDPRVEKNDSTNERESTDDHKNEKKGDDHSTTTQVSSHMTSSNGYTDEQLNYYRICFLTNDILVEGLREIFKQEWDKLYKSTLGEWKDEPRNGKDFYNKESPQNQERNAHLLATMKNGNSTEWDCTMLFYAILFSDCVGARLSAIIRKNVDDLRKFKNEEFTLMPTGTPLSEIEFQNAIRKVDVAFHALGLPTVKIQNLKYQITFPTKQLTKVLKEVVDNRKQDVQAKECQRQVLQDEIQEKAPSFCILPPKPSHVISNRDREVDEIIQRLKELKKYSGNGLSWFFISGNPGSGKSQLAGLVAKRFYDEVIEMPGGSSFVMTLNAASQDSLLESYASFARHLNYPDYLVEHILETNGSGEAKIAHLEFLIARKIDCYTSWLLVVDNVTTMSTVRLPHFELKPWARGQLLITTQDTTSIPLQSAIIKHISVSKGMEPADALSLLVNLSGVADSELGTIIAQKLDYQPLALASAAVFVGTIRQHKAFRYFGWEEYLSELEEANWGNTEDALVNTNSLYPNTMAKAVTLAVKFLMRSDRFVKDLFTFLSLCAPQPLNVDIPMNYIVNLSEDFDEADRKLILMKLMRCSLLLVEEQDSGHFIRVHQLVHDAIEIVRRESHERQNHNVVIGIVTSFYQFILALPPINRRLHTMHIIPHVRAFCRSIPEVSNILCHDNLAGLFLRLREQGVVIIDVANIYRNLAVIHVNIGDLEQAKKYQHMALSITVGHLGATHFTVAMIYFELAFMYKESGSLEQAKKYQQRAIKMISVKLKQGIPQDLNALEQPATEYHQYALTTQICPEHLSVAMGYSNSALIHQEVCDLKEAKGNKLGAEHFSVTRSFCNFCLTRRDLADLEKTKEYQERAIAIDRKNLGAEHASVNKLQ